MKQEFRMSVNEVIISFKYIILQCLKKIPFILCMTIAFALLFPTIMYVKDYKSYENFQQNQSTEERELTSSEMLAVKNYILLENRLRLLEEREEESIYMRLDPSNFYEVCLQYKVMADESAQNEIVKLFTDYINSSMLASQISEIEGVDETKYLREIISVTNYLDEGEETNGVFNVCIWAENNEQGAVLMNAVMNGIGTYDIELGKKIGEHSLILLKTDGEYRWSDDLYLSHLEFYKEKKELIISVEDCELSLTEAQKKVANNLLVKESDNTADYIDEVISEPKFNIKFMIIGGVAGFIFAIALIFVYELFGGKIQTKKELYERLGINHLLDIKIKSNSLIGKLIDKAVFSKEIEDTENKMELLANLLRYQVKDNSKIMISSSIAQRESSILGELEKTLRAKGIECEVIDVTKDMQKTFAYIEKNKNIVLVEFIGESIVKNVYEEYERCCQMSVNIIGYISITK